MLDKLETMMDEHADDIEAKLEIMDDKIDMMQGTKMSKASAQKDT